MTGAKITLKCLVFFVIRSFVSSVSGCSVNKLKCDRSTFLQNH